MSSPMLQITVRTSTIQMMNDREVTDMVRAGFVFVEQGQSTLVRHPNAAALIAWAMKKGYALVMPTKVSA